MKLAELIANFEVRAARGPVDIDVAAVTDDSRNVIGGALFVARPGTVADGRRFISDAVTRGAVAVLTDEPDAVPAGPTVLMPGGDAGPAVLVGRLAERFHGDPSRRLRLVGITGTNGKTTTAHLVRDLLAETGIRCGLIGTVCVHDGSTATPARLTTPGAAELSGLLARMVAAGCVAAVMEVSSHALAQDRTAGLSFAGAVFTNLSGDHLDYHGSMDAYAAAKARLFAALPVDGWAVLNADDAVASRMAAACRGRVIACRVGGDADATAAIEHADSVGTRVRFRGPWGEHTIAVPLVGAHNVANTLEAAAVAHELGVPDVAIAAALTRCVAPPGRLERVSAAGDPYAVLVDYAHTDDALLNVLAGLRPLVPDGSSLRVVFGCGGDRDRGKRPRMAAAAWRHADAVIITSDNPRTEDPEAIIDDIMPGVPPAHRDATLREADRARAIGLAIERCGPGDVLLIAGKGHEDYQIVGTERRAFDDRLVAAAKLAAMREEVAVR